MVYADDDEVEGDSDGYYHLVVLKIVRNEGKDEKDGGGDGEKTQRGTYDIRNAINGVTPRKLAYERCQHGDGV